MIGISTSGKSVNIIKAKELGTLTVGFTGNHIEEMSKVCNKIFSVNSEKTPYIQETHILLGHILCQLIEYQDAVNHE